MIILIALAAVVATLIGGMVALKFHDRLHLILGFSAGAIISVAFFDLLPEALELAGNIEPTQIFTVVAFGFFSYLILDRFVLGHCHDDNHCHNEEHGNRGRFGAGSLSLHSFLDGLAIGLAFQISTVLGAIVTVAVLTHDFSDGVNTVGLILRHGGSKREALKWLSLDAIAPAVGILVSTLVSLPEVGFSFILAIFAGFFLYIGASDLLPESHHAHPAAWTTVATILGVLVMYGAITLAGLTS